MIQDGGALESCEGKAAVKDGRLKLGTAATEGGLGNFLPLRPVEELWEALRIAEVTSLLLQALNFLPWPVVGSQFTTA